MRIAFITPTLQAGGYEKVIIAYANELSRRGHKVDILCGEKTGELIDTVESNIQIYDFQARARSFLFPLKKYLKNNKVDILYSAFREFNCISVLAKRFAKANVCIYATQHGFQKDNPLMAKIKGSIISKADKLIAVASGVADYEAKELHLDRNRFYISHNPVLDKRVPIKEEYHPWFSDDIPIIAIEGRLAEGKGQDYSLRILANILKTKMVRMIILGDGPLKGELIELAKRFGVAEQVGFLGYVSNPIGYLSHCTLFLHTALAEGFGNVIVEALYAGLPICSTNCSGPLEIIENGKYGVDLGSVKDEGFVDSAAEKIIKVLNGEYVFHGMRDRAMDYEVQSSTDEFLSIFSNEEKG